MSKELTEQYHNGTLPCGFYYFTNGKDIYPIHYQQVKGLTAVRGVEVVAEVPTYEEYLKLESDSLAKQEGVEIVAELENAIGSQADYFRQQISVLEDRLKEANKTLMYVAAMMTCDPADMLETYPDFCADQWALDAINKYLEKYKVEEN